MKWLFRFISARLFAMSRRLNDWAGWFAHKGIKKNIYVECFDEEVSPWVKGSTRLVHNACCIPHGVFRRADCPEEAVSQ